MIHRRPEDLVPMQRRDFKMQPRNRVREIGFGVVLAGLIGTGVSLAQDVQYNYAQDVDFARYKTYKWVTITGTDVPDPLLDKQIKQAIDAQLATKGLTRTEENPDLLLAYQLSVSQEKQITSFNSGDGYWGYGPGWGRGYGYMGPSISTATTSTIHVGNLVLDFYDSAGKDLIWRGQASKTLGSPNPEKRQRNLNKAMAKLLKNYPPKKK
jgi:Domain of unknown function (DUF4136)